MNFTKTEIVTELARPIELNVHDQITAAVENCEDRTKAGREYDPHLFYSAMWRAFLRNTNKLLSILEYL